MRVVKIGTRYQPVTHTGAVLWDETHNRDLAGYASKIGAVEALSEILEGITWFCACSWIGQDPDERRGKAPTCPACMHHDGRRVEVKPAPPCRLGMGCLCCYHARGGDYRYPCNADEAVWPCRFCWAFIDTFEATEDGKCAACDGTGVHPDEDGDPSKDSDADPTERPARCPKCKGQHLAVTETYTAMHPYDATTHHATNALGSDVACSSEHFDDGREDYGAVCRSCAHEGSLAEFGMLLVDWS